MEAMLQSKGNTQFSELPSDPVKVGVIVKQNEVVLGYTDDTRNTASVYWVLDIGYL